MSAWTDHVAKWKDCTACPLSKQRDRIVMARGQVPADAVFIGEAPGASEDALGFPFVGAAGRLLDQIVERALPPTVTRIFTNLVCCFPREAKMRGDHEPEQAEIVACRPRLVEFVRLCQPKLIVLVGRLAAQFVHGTAMFRLGHDGQPEWIPDSRFLGFCEIAHPAAILRMPLAQRNMATQKAIVVLRQAVADMVQWPTENLDPKWSKQDADITTRERLRSAYADWEGRQRPHNESDIPF